MKKTAIIALSLILFLVTPCLSKTATIIQGVVRLTGPGDYSLSLDSGMTGDLTRIVGLGENDIAMLYLTDGEATIRVRAGVLLRLQQGRDFILNNENDWISFRGKPRGICVEIQRFSGGD